MSFSKVSHIGIAVFSIEKALQFYRDKLGLSVSHLEEVESEGVRVAMLQVGETRLELLEPLNASSPLRKFLEKRGEGVHHVALGMQGVCDLAKALTEGGVNVLGPPRHGAGGALITFVHPKDTHGVLLELCED